MESVRSGTTADRARVEELFQQLLTVTSGERSAQRFNTGLRQFSPAERLDNGESSLLVATVDEYVAGFALVGRDAEDQEIAVLEEIFVEPAFRGLGLGELLVDAAVASARQSSCRGIEFSALPGDRSSKNLAERSGFRAREIVMYRSL